jgi:hypothetical protein
MEKKCLIIAYHFYPSNDVGTKRYNLFTSFFSKRLKKLDVLTIKENYLYQKDETFIHGGKIYRTGFYPRFQDNARKLTARIINRIVHKFFPIDHNSAWIIPALIEGIRIIIKDKINVVIVTGPPFSPFVTAYLLSIIFGIDLVIDYQDPWSLADDYEGSFFKRKYTWFIEKLILKKAKRIIFNTQTALDKHLKQKFKFDISNKSYVVPNPYLCKEVTIEPLLLEEKRKVILYAGNFYGKRRIKYLFEPLLKLYSSNELKETVSIHVFGKLHKEDGELIKKLNLSDIVFEHERINYSLLEQYMKGADILYLSQGDDHRDCVPYKLTDYLTIKRPVLALTSPNSATDDFMKEVDCGIAADMDDPDSIYRALKELLLDERRISFDGIEKYSLNNVAEKYYQIINDLQ